MKLSPRHYLMAYMVAVGRKQTEIAEVLDTDRTWVSSIASSPLFKLQVQEIQKQIREGAVEDVLAMIRGEGPESVRKLVELRDNAFMETTQLAAANSLLDRGAAPKRHTVEEDHTLRIIVSRDEMDGMREAVVEAGFAIDVTPRGRLLAMAPDMEDE